MPISPATATVREVFTPDDRTPPVADGEGRGQVAGDEPGGRSRTRRIALIGACVIAFALGFAGMTVLTRGSDSASSSSTKPTQPAPAATAPAAPPSSSSTAKAPSTAPAPPSSALVDAVGNDRAPTPQSSQASAPPMPRNGNTGPPTPSTTTPVPSTTTPTTTPSTTTP